MTTLSLSQTPDALNIRLRQYQQWNIAFSYCGQDANGNYDLNDPIDLTGFTPLLQFRTSALAKTAALSVTVGSGITFVADECPQVTVGASLDIAPGKYEWDLRMINNSEPNDSIFLGQGTVIVEAEVSRNA
jgi:hypothetical protein